MTFKWIILQVDTSPHQEGKPEDTGSAVSWKKITAKVELHLQQKDSSRMKVP